jgi:hypothetical protein
MGSGDRLYLGIFIGKKRKAKAVNIDGGFEENIR